ncbi:MAG TPA: DUF4058 family protein [Gemmataceae bacterium]|jgi:hypothetical protein
MPLLDHFHSPLSERRPWESFHTTWASALADALNQDVLPPGYIALEQVHPGAALEIDVATFTDAAPPTGEGTGGIATVPRTVWVPATAPLVFPASFPPSATVEVLSTEGGRTLVAAIELVSPGNKDRAAKRRLFAAKCATYLSRGVGLVILDVVTSRQGNLHNELADLLGLDAAFRLPAEQSLYAVAYRPLRAADTEKVEAWPTRLSISQPLPTVPLSLGAECCVPVDLEEAYREACRRRRVDEVVARAGE